MKPLLTLALLLPTLLLLPAVSAQYYQESWNITNFPEGANTKTLSATHSYNPDEKRLGNPFWVSAAAWSNAEVTSMPTPTFFYRMDDAVGSTIALDSSINQRHGTVAGNPVFQSPATIATGLRFDGADDRVTITDEAALDVTTFTFATWVAVETGQTTTSPRIIDKVPAAATTGWRINYGAAADQFVMTSCNIVCDSFGTASTFPEGATYHLAATYDAATNAAILYVNGAVANTATFVNDPAANTQNMFLGIRQDLDMDFKGTLDHVQFFNSVLTAAEIRFLAMAQISSYPWITELETTGCVVEDDTETYAGQYQFSRAWLLNATTETCTWRGQIQYFDPGVGTHPAVDIYFTGSVVVPQEAETPETAETLSLPGFASPETIAFLVLLVAMLWAMWNGKYFTAVCTLIGVIWTLTEVYESSTYDPAIFLVGIGFFILSLWIEVIAGGLRARRLGQDPNG